MKEYIVLTMLNGILVFNYRTINSEERMFVNKNSFYKDSLYYGLKYYKRHNKRILNLLFDKANSSIKTIKVLRLVTFKYPFDIIEKLKIENLVLDFYSTMSLEDYKLFLESNNIKNIYCYFMPSNIREEFSQKGINVSMSSIKDITDEFFKNQDALSHDELYYKKVVNVSSNYPELIDDLTEFLKINYNLKAIHVYVYSKELIEKIVDLVKNDESRNVIIYLHQGYDKGDFIVNNFAWLKDLSNKCKEDYTCEFRIIYANTFLRNNLFKQLTFNNLKLISILCIYVCVVSLIIVKSYDYIEQISVEQLRNQIASEVKSGVNEEPENFEYNETPIEADMENSENLTKEEIHSRYSFTNSIKSLKKINKETKGYLVVNNTEISYPVVQHSDNNYYLKHDIYKRKTSMGWVYFDYRNKVNKLDDNTIIYGHSMLNGTMFGTLKKTLNSTWRKNEENMIISLTTEKGEFKFKIFSIYKVDYTTDYLRVNFNSKEEKEEFIKLIKGRSSFKNDTEVGVNDKILTLSTCTGGNNRRLVVHAVLIKE